MSQSPTSQAALSREKLIEITFDFTRLENANRHTEEVLLFANHFGEGDDVERAQAIVEAARSRGLRLDDPLWEEKERLRERLLPRFQEALQEKGLEKNDIQARYSAILKATEPDPDLEWSEEDGDFPPVYRDQILGLLKKEFGVE